MKENKKQVNLVCNFILFVSSGLFVLGFEPFNYHLLSIIAMVVITLCLLSVQNLYDAFIKSYIISIGLSIFGFYWLINSAMHVVHSYIVAVILLLGFSILYTAFIFPTVYLIYKAPKQGYALYGYLFISWLVIDVLKEYLFGGLPWFTSGYIWTSCLYIIQSTAIFGIFGLSVVTIALVISIVYAILPPMICHMYHYKRFIPLGIMLLVFVGLNIFGYIRVSSQNDYFTGKKLSLRIVQPNILQEDKLNPNKALVNFEKTMALTFDNLNDKNLNYIILPEVAFSFIVENYPEFYNQLVKSIPINTKLIMGALRESEGKYYNSVYILNTQGKRLAYYDKRKLVPFGEYIPLSNYMPFITSFSGVSNLTPGSIDNTIILDEFIYNILICFEGVFNSTNLSVANLDFILNLSNEGWFDETIEVPQNIAMYKVRAIENGVVAIKVSNRGPSGVFNSLGQVIQLTKVYKADILDTTINLEKRKTFYSAINGRLINTLIVILIGLLYIIMLRWR